uniref:Rubredoxin-like domain-containing protein n=1 Tax=Phaeomonas parva TaxID=124430 RepID=A0A6U4H457_9STRA|mmetsp:Transcript_34215/g.107872  ORF Transcript_34215/g.107872 Transcript_34215/m.107872 type:complete len:143 (+) Transcript_34215:174-602(+)|eukprot:CAMPEP_0118876306 /NCGR_PEP_ID=MMETSP1163-20130328/17054_1 /TAXON_ID=124430 /ORGANISM="Phaeomonas parva, Strain CCMP2877" /LENGTH=142 /DNA_ID=CAMNT_0006811909 /DNA_START=104 /DNA_END=532 /DNA_ORIENTATION=-
MMRTLVLALALAAAAAFRAPLKVGGKVGSRVARLPARAVAPSVTALSARKAAEEEIDFWQGDWVCADCGYIYDRGECNGLYFEEQPRGFRCPQCRGPRRRYAKKVGDRVGLTLDGGDAPILLFSYGGLIAVVVFGFWYIQNL